MLYDHIPMTLSGQGLTLLKQLEGCELVAYLDTAGKWTIGFGHIATAHAGMVITKAEAERLLVKYDLPKYVDQVNQYTTVALSQRQFDALVIFCFNVGRQAYATSTLLKLVNAREYVKAENEFKRWVYSGGKVTEGLKNRRAAEARLWDEGIWT